MHEGRVQADHRCMRKAVDYDQGILVVRNSPPYLMERKQCRCETHNAVFECAEVLRESTGRERACWIGTNDVSGNYHRGHIFKLVEVTYGDSS